MKAAPQVSVVVRSMARPSLDAALAALAAQDYPRLEVVVVAACGAAHPEVPPNAGAHPLRLVRSDAALSRPRAGNVGLLHARGDWITFLDDDDVCLAEHVSGLVQAATSAATGDATVEVVYSYARARFRNGTEQRFGLPYSLMELYERNFIHLSTALIARGAVEGGCRFDESLDVHEDWDFFLQLAQRRPLHFVPRETFVWNADAGSSGAGGGANQDDPRFAAYRDRVYAKWGAQRDALVDRVEPLLHAAANAAQRGELAVASATCEQVLQISPNDPFALNLRAMIERAGNDLAASRRTQEMAAAVRPHDPDFAYNLALVCRDTGDLAAARGHVARALVLDPTNARARALASALAAAPNLPTTTV